MLIARRRRAGGSRRRGRSRRSHDERAVDAVTQRTDVLIDDVRTVLIAAVPRAFQQLITRQHRARPAHEDLQQREALRRQLDSLACAPHLPRRRIQAQIADLQDHGPFDGLAADQRPQARHQLSELEWLGEVVVGTAVESCDAVGELAAGGQHPHRCPDLIGS
jgi:hypothetical protein